MAVRNGHVQAVLVWREHQQTPQFLHYDGAQLGPLPGCVQSCQVDQVSASLNDQGILPVVCFVIFLVASSS